ncbi:hypothetical protein WJX73_003719 [Symbiochloris irregularis]|uniref:Uncharacterized protein n=1 Tax=Symbiochloris irregularis TaxID=706552 RepID=A0AAW1PZD8_9CHLO
MRGEPSSQGPLVPPSLPCRTGPPPPPRGPVNLNALYHAQNSFAHGGQSAAHGYSAPRHHDSRAAYSGPGASHSQGYRPAQSRTPEYPPSGWRESGSRGPGRSGNQ